MSVPRAPLSPVRFSAPVTVTLRSPSVVQVGLDADRGLLLPDAPPGADAALRAIARGSTAARAMLELQPRDRLWLSDAIAALGAGGLVTQDQPRRRTLVVVGSGPLAGTCRALLEASGVALVGLRPPTGPEPAAPVLVASERVEPERHLLEDLQGEHRPHLVVRVEPERAVVGPFVEAGTTPCIRCLDLVRTDLDERWPHVLAQLCRMESAPDAAAAAWVAATATAQLRAWWAGRRPEAVGATIELDAATWHLEARRWPQHPECGCRWGQRA